MAFFSKGLDKLKGALRKTAQVLNTDVRTLFIPGRQINDEFLGEIGDRLMGTDMGVRNVDRIVDAIRDRWRLGKIRNADEAAGVMREQILQMLTAPADGDGAATSGGAAVAGATAAATAVAARPATATASDGQERELRFAPAGPTVILVAGINGAGKTTSIAKLAWLLKNEMGKRVMVAA